jgi:hypothetical protein
MRNEEAVQHAGYARHVPGSFQLLFPFAHRLVDFVLTPTVILN